MLGGFEVTVDGRPAELGGPKPRTLLALLVAAEGRPVSVEQLVEQIWGEEPPARVEAALQSYVARLRRELEPSRQVRATPAMLRTHPGAYSLKVADQAVDVRRFVTTLREARSVAGSEPAKAEAMLVRALDDWGGEPYQGLAVVSSALAAEVTRLLELRAAAQEELWALRVDRGGPGDLVDAVAELEHLVGRQPLRERLWALLALAQYRAARQGEALETLRRARTHLADELGIDPGAELQALETAMLRQDPGLLRVTREPQPTSSPRRWSGSAELVGREAELDLVDRALADGAGGQGRVVLVSGEPGVGKTRLSEAVLARASELGLRTGRGGWDADGTPPLWAWRQALTEALGRRELLDPVGEAVLDATSETYRLAEVVLAAFREEGPTVLVLDDLHWADPESLRLLRRVAAEISRAPVVLLATVRAAAAERTGLVGDVLGALARVEPVRVELKGLDPTAVRRYVREQAGTDVTPDVASELARRTGGNPFYVGELVRLLSTQDALDDPGATAWRTVPTGVREVVRRRLAPVPETARVLEVAAVLGRSFELDVLHEASRGAGHEVGAAVESALELDLVQETAPGRFRFRHAIVRDAVYETIPATARSRIHADVAVALEHRHAGSVAEKAADLAEHYRAAGPAHVRSAWTFARSAGEAATGRSLHHEAHRLLAGADELQRLDPTVTAEEREEVQVSLGRTLRQLARPLEAWAPLAAAGASALRRGNPLRAAEVLLEITVGAVWGWRHRAQVDEEAIALWEQVLREVSGTVQDGVRARVEAALAVELLYQRGSAARATGLVDAALERCRRSGTDADVTAVLQLCGMALARPQHVDRRVAITDELVTSATRAGDEPGLAVALVGRAAARAELGLLDEARSDMVRARHAAELHHLGQIVVIAGWGTAVHELAHGRYDAVESQVAELRRVTESLSMPGAGIDDFLIATTRLHQGRLGELEAPLRAAARVHPTAVRDLHALSLVELGRHGEARELLGAWSEQPPLLEDYLWLTLTVLRAWLWSELGDRDAVEELRRSLEPYAAQVAAGSMSSSFLGSVSHTLGRLARTAGDVDAARDHLDVALRTHEALGLEPWVRLTREELARLPA